MKWTDIKRLHIELSALCNAACPNCARYPTSSYYQHPNISSSFVWTLDQVKARLPPDDLNGIKEILINGTVGDFVTNSESIEIIKYIKSSSDNCEILINTNGSARSFAWWEELASIPDLVVNFAIDGLEDTHSLYRRNTSWHKIIDNAKIFMSAGGTADWTMITFAHNLHQVEDCKTLSNALGFRNFYVRPSDRPSTVARNRDGSFSHIVQSTNVIFKIEKNIEDLKRIENNFQNNNVRPMPAYFTRPLPNKNLCESIREESIYIGSDWTVVPCCFYGALAIYRETDSKYKNFVDRLSSQNLTIDDLKATDNRTVKDCVDRGFDWIYNNLQTTDNLVTCYQKCHPDMSNYKNSWNKMERPGDSNLQL